MLENALTKRMPSDGRDSCSHFIDFYDKQMRDPKDPSAPFICQAVRFFKFRPDEKTVGGCGGVAVLQCAIVTGANAMKPTAKN
jgi:hypothetical protein